MALTKKKKQDILDFLKKDVAKQKAVVLITTKDAKKPLDAANNYQFRSTVHAENIGIKLIKNTLIEKAFSKSEIPKLTDQVYVAYKLESENTDEIEVPKAISKQISKDFADYFEILGGIINDKYQDGAYIKVLSTTPSIPESMSIIAGMLKQIGGGKLAATIKEIPSQIARGTNEISKQKS